MGRGSRWEASHGVLSRLAAPCEPRSLATPKGAARFKPAALASPSLSPVDSSLLGREPPAESFPRFGVRVFRIPTAAEPRDLNSQISNLSFCRRLLAFRRFAANAPPQPSAAPPMGEPSFNGAVWTLIFFTQISILSFYTGTPPPQAVPLPFAGAAYAPTGAIVGDVL